MSDESPAGETTLRLRPWTFVLPGALPAAAMLALVPYGILVGVSGLEVGCLGAVAVLQAVPPILGLVGAHRQPWSVKIGPEGVTWQNPSRHLPWSAVAQVRASTSWWRRLLVPGVRLVDERQASFAARAGSRPTTLLIDTRHLDMSAEQVVQVIARHTDHTPVLN